MLYDKIQLHLRICKTNKKKKKKGPAQTDFSVLFLVKVLECVSKPLFLALLH